MNRKRKRMINRRLKEPVSTFVGYDTFRNKIYLVGPADLYDHFISWTGRACNCGDDEGCTCDRLDIEAYHTHDFYQGEKRVASVEKSEGGSIISGIVVDEVHIFDDRWEKKVVEKYSTAYYWD